jgi:dienelactone hydrolase
MEFRMYKTRASVKAGATSLRRILRAVSLLVIISSASDIAAAREDFVRGNVIESVVSRQDAGQSYALYLPSSYTPEKKWPIVYGFDPGGRGRLPVELFREAAERYGYILVGSNNSRNGPNVNIAAAIKALWEDSHARLSIDEKRVYAAGMSGGARVAFAFAYYYEGQIAGVIACSAGFPGNISPSSTMPFVVYGTAGTDDFNQPEIVQLGLTLERLGVPHRVEVYAGGHDWPPRVTAERALEWMELQAMRAGRRVRDEAFVEEQFERAHTEARAFEAAGDFFNAYAAYRALAGFTGLRETAEVEKKVSSLRGSKEVREALERERVAGARQQRLSAELEALARASETGEENRITAAMTLRHELGNLRKQSSQSRDTTERRVSRRVLEGFYVQLSQEVAVLFEQKDYARAADRLEIASEVKPDDAATRYVLARAYSLGGRKKKALESLRSAFERGFRDLARLEQDKNFDSLRGESEYKKLVADLRQIK